MRLEFKLIKLLDGYTKVYTTLPYQLYNFFFSTNHSIRNCLGPETAKLQTGPVSKSTIITLIVTHIPHHIGKKDFY